MRLAAIPFLTLYTTACLTEINDIIKYILEFFFKLLLIKVNHIVRFLNRLIHGRPKGLRKRMSETMKVS